MTTVGDGNGEGSQRSLSSKTDDLWVRGAGGCVGPREPADLAVLTRTLPLLPPHELVLGY